MRNHRKRHPPGFFTEKRRGATDRSVCASSSHAEAIHRHLNLNPAIGVFREGTESHGKRRLCKGDTNWARASILGMYWFVSTSALSVDVHFTDQGWRRQR